MILSDKKTFYESVIDVYNRFGTTSLSYLKKYGLENVNYSYYIRKYGGIQNVCKECNIPYRHGLKNNPDLIKEDFQRVYNELGYINTEAYLKYGKYSKQSIKTAFGGVGNLKNLIGVENNVRMQTTKEDVKKDFWNFYSKFNSTSSELYRKNGKFSQPIIDRLFGSWTQLLQELGFSSEKKRYGEEYIKSELKRVYDKHGFISTMIIDSECEFTYQALKPYFNSKEEISKFLNVDNAFKHKYSVGAQLVYNALINEYGKENIEPEKTWPWLKNNITGCNLYVDFYISSINTAIEYDGQQHFVANEWFERNQNSLEKQQYRDRLKDKLLEAHDIKVVRFSYKDKLTPSFITQKIA